MCFSASVLVLGEGIGALGLDQQGEPTDFRGIPQQLCYVSKHFSWKMHSKLFQVTSLAIQIRCTHGWIAMATGACGPNSSFLGLVDSQLGSHERRLGSIMVSYLILAWGVL